MFHAVLRGMLQVRQQLNEKQQRDDDQRFFRLTEVAQAITQLGAETKHEKRV
jgi:hypothetical protein